MDNDLQKNASEQGERGTSRLELSQTKLVRTSHTTYEAVDIAELQISKTIGQTSVDSGNMKQSNPVDD